jgi:hypothetical protein
MQLGPRFRVFLSAHPVLTGIAAVIGVVWILVDWRTFCLLASLVIVLAGSVRLSMLAVDSWRRRRQEKAEIAARADDQDEALLRGDDEWGMFGIRSEDQPAAEPTKRSQQAGRSAFVAGAAVVAGLLVFTMTATVNARSGDRPPRPVSAPTHTATAPASRPLPHSINPTSPRAIPSQGVPAQLPPSPPPIKPSGPVRMGQPAVDGNVTFIVKSVDRSKTVTNTSLPFLQTTAKGIFLTVQLTVTSNGSQPEEFIASYQRLQIGGAVYIPDPTNAVWTLTFETFVSPGTTAVATLSFDVPTDSPAGGILQLHASAHSRGAAVELLPPQ